MKILPWILFVVAAVAAGLFARQSSTTAAQLSRATNDATEIRASLSKAQDLVKTTAAELDNARNESTRLRDDLSKANAATKALQADFHFATNELTKALIEIKQLSPDAARARALPVKVSFRKAVTGDGSVLVIQNMAGRSLPVAVKLTSPTFNKTKTYNLVIDVGGRGGAGMTAEIGYLEGWPVAAGDQIELSSVGYDIMKVTAQ